MSSPLTPEHLRQRCLGYRIAPRPGPTSKPLSSVAQSLDLDVLRPQSSFAHSSPYFVETKPVFRDAFKRSSCLIPMSGYYEWQNTAGGKQPWYFTGLSASYRSRSLGRMEKPRDWRTVEVMHDDRRRAQRLCRGNPRSNVPVSLTAEQFAPWLSGEAGAEFLKPVPNDYLQRWPVSKRVNSSKADTDDAALIEKVELAGTLKVA
jgi:SOS response associated peptidase (SRAP)